MTKTDVLAPRDLPTWIEPPSPPEFRPRDKVWALSRYADVSAALRHPGVAAFEAHTAIHALAERTGIALPFLETQFRSFMFTVNPPWHTRARRFVRFAMRQIEPALSPAIIGELTDDLLSSVPQGVAFDAMTAVCEQLPAMVMARGFGMAEADVAEIGQRAIALFKGLRRHLPLRVLRDHEAQAEYLADLVDRTMRGTATLDAIRAYGRDEIALTDAEIGALLAFLILGSAESTTSFLGNTLQLIGDHPEVTKALRHEPDLLRTGLDELMRYGSPSRTFSLRVATGILDIGGSIIPQEALVVLEPERAHFDPAAYPDPGKIDLRRRGPPSLIFGGGAHVCVGMYLAREEMRALIGRIADRYTVALQLTAPDWSDADYVRRLRRLPIILQNGV